MSKPVFILGGAQTDFARAWSRDGRDLADIARDALEGALADARLEPEAVQSIHVGNAFAELQRGQAHLSSLPASLFPEWIGVPAMRHEAACASGSLAVLAAMAEIEAGRYDCVLVLGVEEERNTPGTVASENMNAAAWVGHEPMPGRFMWPRVFGALSEVYAQRHGLESELLHAVARKNFDQARRNLRAQTRGWTFGPGSFGDDNTANPEIEPGVRRNQCAQITDGGAAVVLASAEFAAAHAKRRGLRLAGLPQILGWGHRSADLPFQTKLDRAPEQGLLFPHVAQAFGDALRRAGLASVRQLDGLEVHDCFAMTEVLLVEHAGLSAPGGAAAAYARGEFALGGAFPVNPSGGLIGGGHPVGATGVRMLLDAVQQVRGAAGGYQVEGARRFGTYNIGGAFGTVCSFVVGSA